MKTFTVFLLCALVAFAVAQDENDHTNGQPGCQTQEEVTRRYWRNNWDPTRFWVCDTLNQPAHAVTCEEHTGEVSLAWLDSAQACVSWSQWEWTPPRAPPSRP
uniref:Putative conserved secreted protein n=1 Tax=Lutzomyia longipalpis TaxID=7200 RepID=A0A7G3AGB6_LUTLO